MHMQSKFTLKPHFLIKSPFHIASTNYEFYNKDPKIVQVFQIVAHIEWSFCLPLFLNIPQHGSLSFGDLNKHNIIIFVERKGNYGVFK
jgi:hypothetical protein